MSTDGPFFTRLTYRARHWKPRRPWQGWQASRQTLHRLQELRALRTCHDPDDVWRCCDTWQRTLSNKWNAREFARKYGCPVPDLYWAGARLSQIPFDTFPARFVVRGTSGTGRRRVAVVANGRDVLRDEPASPAAIRQRLAQPWRPWPRVRVLIEEFVTSADGHHGLPLECKCHMFGDTVGAIEVLRRVSAKQAWDRYYRPDWQPFDEVMSTALPLDGVRDPPPCLPDMLHFAIALGRAFGSYVRVDFFAADRGCVFNEFSITPVGGRAFTPYCESLFDALWAEHCPGTS